MSPGDGGNGHDPIASAIAIAEAPAPVEIRQFQVTISSTGRPAAVILPVDASDAEIAEVCGWILTAVMNTHRQERAQPRSGIIVPPPGHIVRPG